MPHLKGTREERQEPVEQGAGFWDRETLVGTVEKNATERIAVRRVERRGRVYVDIRIEWRRQDGDEFFPSKRGVVIPEDAVDDVLALVESAQKANGGRRSRAEARHGTDGSMEPGRADERAGGARA